MNALDTIHALASGASPSAIAIVRLSGPAVRFVVETTFGRLPPARRLSFGALRSGDGVLLDEAMTVFVPGPETVTGEDYAEFHLHGGPAVIRAVMDHLDRFEGVRPAEPGEFTRRAFVNGRIDLTQVESIGDLVSAETDLQRSLALSGVSGIQFAVYEGWRREIASIRAAIEAQIDFSDEEDVGSAPDRDVDAIIDLAERVEAHLGMARMAEIVREGFRVVISGAPNVGKSSLLNALARRDAAIVSEVPGTTRDLIEVALDLGGIKIVLTDTAGLRDTDDSIERIGVARAMGAIERADAVLVLGDAAAAPEVEIASGQRTIRVRTKADLGIPRDAPPWWDVAISTVSGAGVDSLVELIAAAGRDAVGRGEGLLPLRQRHLAHLENCRRLLLDAARPDATELRAERLRLAGDALGRLVGRIDVEDLLDIIFERFCIGK